MSRRLPGYTSAIGALLVLLLALAAPSSAAGSGRIDHVQPASGSGLSILYSIPGLAENVHPDPASLKVSVDDTPVDATARSASSAKTEATVRRTAILAIDVSDSMRGERFQAAKRAAKAFLDTVPPDVYVGIVAFARQVSTAQEPTLDRVAAARVVEQLTLSRGTRLYDAVVHAVALAGSDGQRSILVLSDGKDTSATPLSDASAAIRDAAVQVDVVALAQSDMPPAPLTELADAGEGSVLAADNPASLTTVFANEAQTLVKQVSITAELPPGITAKEGTLSVSLDAGGETYTDTAFVTLPIRHARTTGAAPPQPASAAGFTVSKTVMLVGLALTGAALLLLLLGAFGVLGRGATESVADRISAYSRAGSARSPRSTGSAGTAAGSSRLTGPALGFAEKALANNKDLSASLGSRLEAAGMSLRPAEWLLMHVGIAFGAGLVGFLVGGESVFLMVLFLLLGAALPWVYLGIKRTRRIKRFNDQLADTLQLISGSLSAGLSLAQSVDTVVRQGSEPITSEFKRALVEARLGVAIEDGLDSVADRMDSEDFTWVVMAVRIQRDVGGDLAEVLNQVASTIRERAYVQRQVKSLSAEGKLSAYILGALPIVVLVFLLLTNRAYFEPMITTAFGWILLGFGAMLMTMAVFWMRKLIRMEV